MIKRVLLIVHRYIFCWLGTSRFPRVVGEIDAPRRQSLMERESAGPHRLLRSRCGGNSVWQWGSSVGRKCSRCNSIWQGMLPPVPGTTGDGESCRAKELVGQCRRSLLRLYNLHHEALHLAAVPAHFRAEPARPSVLHCPLSDLDEPDCLPDHCLFSTVPMHSKRKHLGPASSWQMSQLWCYPSRRWHRERHLRLFGSRAPSGFNVAIADGNEA